MTYLGYMALANDEGETLELVNAARVKAYTDNLAPSIGLRGCDDCEGLPAALGEDYTTPTEDFAPWYDPTDPATADFYGVYPLGFEGIDDSTRSIESAELTGDGSVVVGSRFAGKDIRVTGMAFAKDEAALYAGVSWLNSALNGTEEGRCFGDRLNIFSSCPPVEVLPPNFDEPYELVNPPTNTSLLLTGVAPGRASTPDHASLDITGDIDIRVMVALNDWTPAARSVLIGKWGAAGTRSYLFTVEPTTGALRLFWSPDGSGTASNTSSASPAVANGEAIGVRVTLDVDNGAGGRTVRFYTSTDGVFWTQLGTDQTTAGVVSIFSGAAPLEVGSQTAGTADLMAGNMYSAEVRNGINGTIVAAPDFGAQTAGATSFVDSTGKTWSIIAPASLVGNSDELASWTTTSGTIAGTVGGVDFDWTAADPLKTACREVTGLMPGERYQLRLRPEAFGNYYVSMGGGCAVRYTNMLSTPRLGGLTMSLQGSTSVDTYPANGAPDGGSSFSRYIVAPNATSPMGMFLSSSGTAGIPVDANETYTWSWYAQKLGPLGGPATRMDVNWYDAAGVLLSTAVGSGQSATMTWTRFTQTNVAPPTAAFAQPRLVWTGIAVAGQTLNTAQAMMNLGATAPDYIDGGYPDARWLGEPNNSMSILEENVDFQTIFGWATTHNPPTEPTVLDFIASNETMFLSIQSLGVSGAPPTTSLLVKDALIRRVARPGVVAFGTGNDAVPPSDGWTHVAPAGMQVTWDLLESAVLTTARNPVGGSTSYTSALHGPQRTLFGLQPGSRYRLMVEFDTSYFATGASAAASVSPIVTISNSVAPLVTYTNDNPGAFTYFWVVEFTATATSALLAFHPGANLSIGSQGSVRWQFNEYMVEEILETDSVPPQPGRFQQRTMYEVKASQGPTLTNVRTSPCGVMGEITYALRAGNPFKYRNPVFAGGLPTGTSVEVADIPCSADGLPQVVNFAYNPSLETNAVDWAGGGTNVTAARSNLFGGYIGDYSFQVTAVAGVGRVDKVTAYYIASNVTSGPIPLGGEEITVSFYVRTLDLASLGVYDWGIYVSMAGFPPVTYEGTVNIAVAETWYRVEQTFTLPSNLDLEIIESYVLTPASLTTGGQVWMDALMIERGSVATDPFDETFPNVTWSGDPNTSALIIDPVAEDVSTDPDCPAPPAPPAPPEIVNACVTVPTSYNRTVVSIPAETVPRNLSAFPIVTLTAGAEPVRQARIRFWPNPGNLTIDNIGPCDFEGEIIVSFLADGATMVIDGVLREATVSKPGFEDQNANHVLYGPGGGPVEWPELSGGIPYLVTLELDSTDTYTDTLMTVDLVVRD